MANNENKDKLGYGDGWNADSSRHGSSDDTKSAWDEGKMVGDDPSILPADSNKTKESWDRGVFADGEEPETEGGSPETSEEANPGYQGPGTAKYLRDQKLKEKAEKAAAGKAEKGAATKVVGFFAGSGKFKLIAALLFVIIGTILLVLFALVFPGDASCATPSDTAPTADGHAFPLPTGTYNYVDTWGGSRAGGRTHHGTDIFADEGTPVLAVNSGTVRNIGSNSLGGNRLYLDGDDGNFYYYAHLLSTNNNNRPIGPKLAAGIQEGTKVAAGQELAYVSNSGSGAQYTPKHLHFGMNPTSRSGGDIGTINPYPHLKAWEEATIKTTKILPFLKKYVIGYSYANSGCPTDSGKVTGLETPPDIGPPDILGYYKLPNTAGVYSGGYGYGNGWECNKMGQMPLLQVIYTVGKTLGSKYPENKLFIGDLNSAGHQTHKTGRDADIDIPGGMMVDGNGYNPQIAIDAAKMFIDTGVMRWIYYNDSGIYKEVNDYAQSKGLPANFMHYVPGHDNHFHIRLEIEDGKKDTRCPQQ